MFPDRKRRSGMIGHARHRPQDAPSARRRLRPPQHGACRGAGAHRAVGDQQAHRAARGRPRHAAPAALAARRRADAGRDRAARARAHGAVHDGPHRERRRVVQQRRQGSRAAGRDRLGDRRIAARRHRVVHARAGQSQHQGRRRGALLARVGAPSARGRRGGRRGLGPRRSARPRAPALSLRPARAGGPSGPSARRSQVAALRADPGPRACRPASDQRGPHHVAALGGQGRPGRVLSGRGL